MSYDFDTIKDRSGTYSIKWNISDGELPMWVADMDFETAPEIKQAIVEQNIDAQSPSSLGGVSVKAIYANKKYRL